MTTTSAKTRADTTTTVNPCMRLGPWVSTAKPDPFTGNELEPVWMVEFQSVMLDDDLSDLQCEYPEVIECRTKNGEPNQKITCDVDVGLDCVGMEQDTNGGSCYDYEVRIGCTDRSLPNCTNDATSAPISVGSQPDDSLTGV